MLRLQLCALHRIHGNGKRSEQVDLQVAAVRTDIEPGTQQNERRSPWALPVDIVIVVTVVSHYHHYHHHHHHHFIIIIIIIIIIVIIITTNTGPPSPPPHTHTTPPTSVSEHAIAATTLPEPP